mmetsp:Transcript_23845/g.47603  ORF Transcript_23845/g.47603 Transcript_23845/m.47603 type:complete len:218 (+) Transcript_23845:566-1219(+)
MRRQPRSRKRPTRRRGARVVKQMGQTEEESTVMQAAAKAWCRVGAAVEVEGAAGSLAEWPGYPTASSSSWRTDTLPRAPRTCRACTRVRGVFPWHHTYIVYTYIVDLEGRARITHADTTYQPPRDPPESCMHAPTPPLVANTYASGCPQPYGRDIWCAAEAYAIRWSAAAQQRGWTERGRSGRSYIVWDRTGSPLVAARGRAGTHIFQILRSVHSVT